MPMISIDTSREQQTAVIKSLIYIMTSDGSVSPRDIDILKAQLNNVPFKLTFYSLDDALESQAKMSLSGAVDAIRSFSSMNKYWTKMMWKNILYGSGTP